MKRFFVWAMLVLLVGHGCGGGGPATGGTGIPASYYPVSVGAKWAYESTSSTSTVAFIDEMVITRTKLISGVTAWVFNDSNVVGFPPESATRYLYPTRAAFATGVLAAWLRNAETLGTGKSVAGTLIWPRVSR